ncbi:unnamed protein product, partial [Rotaria sordida]
PNKNTPTPSTTESNIPYVIPKNRAPFRPPPPIPSSKRSGEGGDSYV